MGRSIKLRTVCEDKERSYIPKGFNSKDVITLTIEEYETIRLIDYEKLSQLECSQMMNVARTTVQAIYEQARYKISDALIHQKSISIKGGHYALCSHGPNDKHCAKNKLMQNGE